MFLVQPAREAMSRNFVQLPEEVTVSEAIKQVNFETNRVIVTSGPRIAGFLFDLPRYPISRTNTGRNWRHP
ncbi:MAG: hypothetical protein R3D29_14025 [Nitratireductor sp.]